MTPHRHDAALESVPAAPSTDGTPEPVPRISTPARPPDRVGRNFEEVGGLSRPRARRGSLILPLLLGLLVAVPLGVAYGVFVRYSPFPYFNFVATIVVGTLVGRTIRGIASRRRTPGMGGLAIVGALAGTTALWAAWVTWVFAISDWYPSELDLHGHLTAVLAP